MATAKQQAVQDEQRFQARKEWFQLRVEQIHRNITAYDVLSRHGVSLQGRGEEQFSCPFHGRDEKPSARIYPESPRSPSHAWCFVCQERWDAISLWRKFAGDDKPFSRVLTEIERSYGLETPDIPKELRGQEGFRNKSLDAFDALLRTCEARLLTAKGAYRHFNDLVGYLSASSILDKVQHRVSEGTLDPDRGIESLKRLLEKIGEKIRSCPAG